MNRQKKKRRQFNFYPSLLNSFSMYLREEGYEKDDVEIQFVTFEDLINRINRVETPTTEAQQKGKDFEDVVLGRKDIKDTIFSYDVVEKAKQHLPSFCRPNVYVEVELDNTLIYGYADLIGEGRVVDIKTTSRYQFPKYLTDHQNLYLLALKDKGVFQMDYVITNFSDVFKESFYASNLDFSTQYNEIERFKKFLIDNRNLITDKKIFNEQPELV